ncbi:MAG: GyrI-like domain-containing protein [Fusobacteriales bacterium]|jgi:effector-binding domain-containing protein|nr:GyrI-like domain-containing protein [Fusobacteriales bacterium]
MSSETLELSGSLCATVLYKDPYSNLTSVYTKLNQWIETEGYKFIDAAYEIYLTNSETKTPENYMTEIYFPAAKK